MMRAHRAGMTLMELMVGIIITGVMASIGAAAFNSIIDHRRLIIESTAEMERAAALRELLRSWIGSATIQITTGGAQGRTQLTSFGGGGGITRTTITQPTVIGNTAIPSVTAAVATGDELTVVTAGQTPLMTPQTRMRLFVDGDQSTPETGLTIEYQATTATPLMRMQLDSSIVMMTVEFLDRVTNRWYPFSEAATITPIAVRVWFPPVDDVYVPALLQYPMLFVTGQTAAQQQTGGR